MCGSPQIEANHMTNLTVKPGASVVFNCKVIDFRILKSPLSLLLQVDLSCMVSTIRWYHEMENGTEVLIKTPQDPGNPYTLDIPSVSMTDMGMYTCVARNVVGRDHVAAYLQVDHGGKIGIE